jgi:hypothetical protein
MNKLAFLLCLMLTACSCGGGHGGPATGGGEPGGGGGNPVIATKFKYTPTANPNVFRILEDTHTSTDTRIVLYLTGPAGDLRAFALIHEIDKAYGWEQLSVYIPANNRVWNRGNEYAVYALSDSSFPGNDMIAAWAINLPPNRPVGTVTFKITKFQSVDKARVLNSVLPDVGILEAVQ